MSFNKRYIQDIDTLKKRREEYSSDREFLSSVVGKSDALIGSKESLAYLDSIYEKINDELDGKNPNR